MWAGLYSVYTSLCMINPPSKHVLHHPPTFHCPPPKWQILLTGDQVTVQATSRHWTCSVDHLLEVWLGSLSCWRWALAGQTHDTPWQPGIHLGDCWCATQYPISHPPWTYTPLPEASHDPKPSGIYPQLDRPTDMLVSKADPGFVHTQALQSDSILLVTV